MTKRPKLSLSSPQRTTKKRPSSFKVTAAPSQPTRDVPPEPPEKPAASAPPRPSISVSAPPRGKREDASFSKQPTWLNKSAIAKVVLVLGAAAVSIFLLKRRLF